MFLRASLPRTIRVALGLAATLSAASLLSCSSAERTTAQEPPESAPLAASPAASLLPEAGSPPVATGVPKEKETDVLFRQARQFDGWLTNQLDPDEVSEMERDCHTTPDLNPFCFAIMNRDLLDQKTGPRKVASITGSRRSHAVRPRFYRRKLSNWLELRFAPLNPLIRGVASVRPSDLEQVRRMALAETQCPNNAAIAVAATLEDQLREGLEYEDIARLYEKGGDCLIKSPADRENLLTRAGLFFFAKKDYRNAARVLAKSAAISDTFVARPLYWLYRARTELRQTLKAKETLDQLQKLYPFSFHTLIGLTSNGKDPGDVLKRVAAPHLTRSMQVPAVNHLIEEVEVLHRFGFKESAGRVLDWVVQASPGVEPEVMIYVAELKREQGDYHSKITLLSDILYKNPSLVSRDTLELYFPKVFFPIFEKQSQLIDPYFLIAIARRESAFRASVISHANARGLLQVMPQTGRRIKGRANLLDPETNVEIGARYITELLEKMGGQVHFALAAYNAGPHKLTTWADRYPTDDPILFIDLIPYRETREYVASVLRNYYWYRRIHKNDDKMSPKRLIQIATSP